MSRPITFLTFGVEFEFLVPYLIQGTPDPSPQQTPIDILDPATLELGMYDEDIYDAADDAVRDRIESTIRNGGHPVSDDDSDEVPPRGWKVHGDSTIYSSERMRSTYEKTWTDVEVVSPALQLPDGPARIRQVCRLLCRNYRIFTPRSCGLHVHVGNGNRGFHLPTIENLAAFLWTFERQFASLHPRHRQGGEHCQSMRTRSNLRPYRNDIAAGIQRIYSTQSKRELVRLTHRTSNDYHIEDIAHFNRHMAYNFTNLIHGEKRTVEFRQFEGTMDHAEVENWVRCCVGLVHFAKNTDENAMRSFLMQEAARNPAPSLRRILSTIGMAELAQWARERVARLYPNGFNF